MMFYADFGKVTILIVEIHLETPIILAERRIQPKVANDTN
jgi:hypothetical protein